MPPVPSDSGYASSYGLTPTSGHNSAMQSAVPSTYAQSSFSDGTVGPVHCGARSETVSRYEPSMRGRSGSIKSTVSRLTTPSTMRVDEDTRYRAVRTPCFVLTEDKSQNTR